MTAARDLFATYGYAATSVAMITARAGVASGAFYVYFRSKRQLLVVLMEEALEVFEFTDLRPSADEPLHRALRLHVTGVFEDAASFHVVRAWREAALHDAEIAALHNEITAWTYSRVARLVRHLQRRKRARSERDVQAFARLINDSMWRLLEQSAGMTPNELRREMRVWADVIYHYLFCDGDADRARTRIASL